MDITAAFLKGNTFDIKTSDEKHFDREAYFELPDEEDYEILLNIDTCKYALLATEYLDDVTLQALKGLLKPRPPSVGKHTW